MRKRAVYVMAIRKVSGGEQRRDAMVGGSEEGVVVARRQRGRTVGPVSFATKINAVRLGRPLSNKPLLLPLINLQALDRLKHLLETSKSERRIHGLRAKTANEGLSKRTEI